MRRPPERPLDPLPTLKLKLSVVILAAVAVTVIVFWAGVRIGVWPSVCGIVAGAIALAVVWFLARGITSPLREMVAASEAMARGDFSQRVTVTSRDEIGTLARSFNQMAAELAETDRLRRDLVANVSHELRTPITALQAVLENIVDRWRSPTRRPRPCSRRSAARSSRATVARPVAARSRARWRSIASLRSNRCSISRCASRGCTPEPFHWRPASSLALLVGGDGERLQVVANLVERGAPLAARRA
jgi:signal transduction histidine kinase